MLRRKSHVCIIAFVKTVSISMKCAVQADLFISLRQERVPRPLSNTVVPLDTHILPIPVGLPTTVRSNLARTKKSSTLSYSLVQSSARKTTAPRPPLFNLIARPQTHQAVTTVAFNLS